MNKYVVSNLLRINKNEFSSKRFILLKFMYELIILKFKSYKIALKF